jgi:hypothetical protein
VRGPCVELTMPDPFLQQLVEALRPMVAEETQRALSHRDNGTDKLLTVDEARAILHCSADYLYRNRSLPFIVRQGRNVRISHQKLQAYLDTST